MKNIAMLLVGFTCTATHAEPRTSYVGGGRYVCSGTTRDCALVNQRNEELSRREYERLERNRLAAESLSEQHRQTRALENIRDELRALK